MKLVFSYRFCLWVSKKFFNECRAGVDERMALAERGDLAHIFSVPAGEDGKFAVRDEVNHRHGVMTSESPLMSNVGASMDFICRLLQSLNLIIRSRSLSNMTCNL